MRIIQSPDATWLVSGICGTHLSFNISKFTLSHTFLLTVSFILRPRLSSYDSQVTIFRGVLPLELQNESSKGLMKFFS